VPFVFVLDPQGVGLLLQLPKGGSWIDVVLITGKAALGLAALAAAAQGWALRRATVPERLALAVAGLLLVFPSLIEALIEPIIRHNLDYAEWIGIAIGLAVVGKQWAGMRAVGPQEPRGTSTPS
jgi:TRAP-type uncharacterized transport system fused permease subunit